MSGQQFTFYSMSKERLPYQYTIEEVARIARETTLKDGAHAPTLIFQDGKRSIAGHLDLGANFDERVKQFFLTGYALAHSGEMDSLQQVFFICEAWVSMPEPGGAITVPPSQDPQRKEALLIDSLILADHTNELVVLEMIRDEQNTLTSLQELESVDEKGSAQSPLLDAFADGFRRGMRGKEN